jgi:hypothetical protein
MRPASTQSVHPGLVNALPARKAPGRVVLRLLSLKLPLDEATRQRVANLLSTDPFEEVRAAAVRALSAIRTGKRFAPSSRL